MPNTAAALHETLTASTDARLAALSPETRAAIDAAADRLDEYGWSGILSRVACGKWRPSPRLPDGALVRLALEMLGL